MGKRRQFVVFWRKLEVGLMTPHGFDMVGASQENAQCTSRIYLENIPRTWQSIITMAHCRSHPI